jgi:ElaB/YqjD/DUF883 family membrane-anchored ribosome-binding protein
MNRMQAMEKNMEKLSDEAIADFKEVVADAEALLKATANQGGEKMAEVRAKAEESIKVAKTRMAEAELALLAKAKAAGQAADAYVHENPWKTIGVAVGFSLVIGLLIGRR